MATTRAASRLAMADRLVDIRVMADRETVAEIATALSGVFTVVRESRDYENRLAASEYDRVIGARALRSKLRVHQQGER
jgi:hypothetical protein